MAKSISPGSLGDALRKELTMYHADVIEKVDAAGDKAVKELVKQTKASAPVASGSFKRNITSKVQETPTGGKRFIWHVKAPDHRLTHLLVHGHAKKNGGRTKANPFLKNALANVLPAYEKDVEEALKK